MQGFYSGRVSHPATTVTFRGLPESDAVKAAVRDQAKRLRSSLEGMVVTGCRVVIEPDERHPADERRFYVKVFVQVPGKELAVAVPPRKPVFRSEDLLAPLGAAFSRMSGLLDSHQRRVGLQLRTRKSASLFDPDAPTGRMVIGDDGRARYETSLPLPARTKGDMIHESSVSTQILAWLCCDLMPPYPLGPDPEVTIGRSHECDLVLPHNGVSRLHGVLRM